MFRRLPPPATAPPLVVVPVPIPTAAPMASPTAAAAKPAVAAVAPKAVSPQPPAAQGGGGRGEIYCEIFNHNIHCTEHFQRQKL